MSTPNAILLAQGDEVLTGRTVDTNSGWLAERLTDLGVRVHRIEAVGDRQADIRATVLRALGDADLVISTGGLGPTDDDLTAAAVADALNLPLAENADALASMQRIFTQHGYQLSAVNRKQALLPQGASVLENRWGTAPGFSVTLAGATGFFLPGVPREMRAFWQHHLDPWVRAQLDTVPALLVTLRCMGVPESRAQELLTGLALPDGVALGYRSLDPEIQIKLRVPADLQTEPLIAAVRERLGAGVFGVDSGSLAHVVGASLAERGETLATAESCTGGQISALVTAVAGSSRYFIEGACVYANSAKVRTCGVEPADLAAHGAVSETVARALAEGIRARAGSTYGIGTTGIAGPDGGTEHKPVGTVHLALATPIGTVHRRLRVPGGRPRVTQRAASAGLDLLRRHLQGVLTSFDDLPSSTTPSHDSHGAPNAS
jgi:nicotinamide-nucleotide amidase